MNVSLKINLVLTKLLDFKKKYLNKKAQLIKLVVFTEITDVFVYDIKKTLILTVVLTNFLSLAGLNFLILAIFLNFLEMFEIKINNKYSF